MPTPQQLREFYEYLRRTLARHGKLALLVAAAVGFLGLVGAFLMPKSYYSEARLFVRFGRENQVDPTATGGQFVSISETRESEINSLIEIFKSRAILDKVVEQLGPDYILYGREKPAQTVKAPAVTTRPGTNLPPLAEPPSRAHQLAVQELEQAVSVWSPRKTNVISVACEAKSPAIAQQIVARLVEVYQAEHVRAHYTAGSYEFFVEQTKVTERDWRTAAEKLRATKDRLAISSVEARRRELEDQLAETSGLLLANESELKTAEAKIASLKKLIDGLPKTVVTQEVEGPNAAFDGMRQTLYNLEARQQELAATRNENHPQLIAVRRQVAELRAILAEQPELRRQETSAVNPSRQALELALLTEQSTADSLHGRGKSLLELQDQLHAKLKELNGYEVTVNQLAQAVDLAESRHREYAEKLEQARINRSLDEDRISSLSLVQPASYVSKATGPRRLYVLAMGMMLAGLSGLGAALIAAWLNPVAVTTDDVRQLFDLPLVGVVPREALEPAGRS
jgi:uncharacterized protein involved in exopolysaccharide biosynthesis